MSDGEPVANRRYASIKYWTLKSLRLFARSRRTDSQLPANHETIATAVGMRSVNIGAYRLARLAISPRPSNLRSAVSKVNLSTFAVAAKNRSAGSACDNGNAMPTLTISRVRGASRNCSAARSTQIKGFSTRTRPFCISVRASHTLTGDSHNSLSPDDSTVAARFPIRAGSS